MSVQSEILAVFSEGNADALSVAAFALVTVILIAVFKYMRRAVDEEGYDDATHDPSEDDVYAECPNCQSQVYEDEVVDGQCPNCATSIADDFMDRIDSLESGACPSCGADVHIELAFGDDKCPECGGDL